MSQPGMNSPYSQRPLMHRASMMPDSDSPTYVMGSHCRVILPGTLVTAAALAPGTTQAKNQILPKNADGRFPCPHCAKTYMHTKHLKRHLLKRKS
jgi:predicted RNA-binding Zn-ribbon protein involved in translation (DUF1610 family)